MLEKVKKPVRALPGITTSSDTRDILAHATQQSKQTGDYFLVDIDAHVTETQFWPEILSLIDDEFIRHMGEAGLGRPVSRSLALLNNVPGMSYQSVYGRIPHEQARLEAIDDKDCHPCVALVRRAMDALGLDYQILFPTPMLTMGMHPQDDVEVALGGAFNKWMVEKILPQDRRVKGLLYLPFNTPEACEKMVEQYAPRDEIIGFTICSTRNKPVHHNSYMRLYSLIEEAGKPLAFHTGFNWSDPSFSQLNRFISMHALSFPHYNQIHLTNWIINGLPERFPKLKVVWVEAGVAWIPYLMQRLDHEFMMRACEAPMLKRKPSDYMREMFFTSQPLERSNLELLEATFKAMNAETQLLYASDWPHWDFDPPGSITSLPFLNDQAKRNILGLNAARIFNLDTRRMRPDPHDVLASRPSMAPA